MFKATDDETYVTEYNHSFEVDRWCEVNTDTGWKCASAIVVGDVLIVDDNGNREKIIVDKVDTSVDNNRIVYYY